MCGAFYYWCLMPYLDAALFNKKAKKHILKLILDDNDSILESIRRGMLENKLKECKVEDASGKVKHAVISFMEGSNFNKMDLRDAAILRASGNFKLNFDELWGIMHISTASKKPITGTVVRGTAAEGFEL